MLILGNKEQSFYETWKEFNYHVVKDSMEDTEYFIRKAMGASLQLPEVHLIAKGLGLPEDRDNIVPLLDVNKRIKVLWKRYIDPTLWEESIERIRNNNTKFKKSSFPSSFSIPFYRREIEDGVKIPKGGGCLSSITLVWYQNRWIAQVNSRASEITWAFMADILFLDSIFDKVCEEAEIEIDKEDIDITWNIGLCSQNRFMTPGFILNTYGEKELLSYIKKEPANDWSQVVIGHFVDAMIDPEVRKQGTRRRWSNWCLENSKRDWLTLREEGKLNE